MCGIYAIAGDPAVDEAMLERGCDVIRHRGPDDWGFHVDAKHSVGLSMRRLSIIDLAGGHQPIFNEDGSVAIVFNGEIYNFQELRRELEALGHVFKTRSDTEAIVHAYEEWGEGCPSRLNGMFAFAIWDRRNRRLFAARDRLGVKPLYLSHKGDRLLLASELKSMLTHPGFSREIDPKALDLFLELRCVPSPFTIYRDAAKLPPAHYLVFEGGGLRTERLRIERYWEPDYTPDRKMPLEERVRSLLDLLRDSTEKRLICDVPFGAFLSGGIDSSAVVALMSRVLSKPVRTFSIGFKGDPGSELPQARQVARLFNTEHHEHVIEPLDLEELLEGITGYLDEPFADSSAIPTWVVSKLARQHVTMVLSGDGGDESFGGYDNYRYHKLVGLVSKLPGSLRQAGRIAAEGVPQGIPAARNFKRLGRFVGQTFLDPADQWWASRGQFLPDDRRKVYTPWFRETLDGDDKTWFEGLREGAGRWTPLTRFFYLDLKLYLADDILVKVDRMSMANSLEVRSPLLDYRVAEFAARLPEGLKLKGLTSKYLLKHALKEVLPKEVLHRKKRGFHIPLKGWLKEDLAGYARGVLLKRDAAVGRYIRPEFTRQLLDEHSSGRDQSMKLWSLLVLESWHGRYLGQG